MTIRPRPCRRHARCRVTEEVPIPLQGRHRPEYLTALAATVASTYARDFVATTASLALLASTLLQDASHLQVLLFLAFSYVMWGAGLRINPKEN